MPKSSEIYSVTDINNRVKGLLDADPLLNGVYVRGELSNYKTYPSGHHYFSLKDKDSSIRCVMFRGAAGKLRFKPESGMGVTAFGRVSVYPRDGAYQLYCEELIPQGAGDLHAALEQLKAKLSAEGLFDAAHKKPLPGYPRRIAVVTSSAGAAVRDIIRVLGKRWPMSEVVILPVRVQGDEAPPEIAGALRYANKYRVGDLIITGRGGGSIEDLWAFNDERVARAIFESEIPVISAVGHEPDVTISDYVADLRAATPSNAAELAVPDQEELLDSLSSLSIRSSQALSRKLTACSEKLKSLASRRVLESPTGYIDQQRMALDFTKSRFISASERYLAVWRQKYVGYAASLDMLSPLKVLSRGFSIATDEKGELITSAGQIQAGNDLDLRLSDGGLKCRVTEKHTDI